MFWVNVDKCCNALIFILMVTLNVSARCGMQVKCNKLVGVCVIVWEIGDR